MTNDDASDTRRVLPSGADFATYSAPMTWFAPGLFSTMTGWPRSSERRAPLWRERADVAAPGEGGATLWTGPEGRGGQHDQYEGGGRPGLGLGVGGRERRIRVAQGQHPARRLQGGSEPHRL